MCNFIQEQHTVKLESCYATYTRLCNSILMLIPLINPRHISSQYFLIYFQTSKILLRRLKICRVDRLCIDLIINPYVVALDEES